MIHCETAENLIQEAIEGFLTLDDRVKLDAHLAMCARCRTAQDEYRSLARLAADWTSAGTPDPRQDQAFAERVARKLGPTPLASRERYAPLLWAACGMLLAAFVGSYCLGYTVPTDLEMRVPLSLGGIQDLFTSLADQWRGLGSASQDWLRTIGSTSWAGSLPPGLSAWLWPGLASAILVNVLCYFRAARTDRRWS